MSAPQQAEEGVKLPAIYVVGGAQGEGQVRDLSREGLFLHSAMLPKEGERVVIKFTTPEGRDIAVQGTVRWNTIRRADKSSPSGFGVRLSSFGNDYAAFVEHLLQTKDRRSSPRTG